jgi:rhodanese-related sulfurtransferase
MIPSIDLASLLGRLRVRGELALIDVRENGQFGAGHLFAAVPLPYSRLELDISRLVPNVDVPVVLCGNDDGVAQLAARRLSTLGYSNLFVLEGGGE